MRSVGRLITTAMVEIRRRSRGADARRCLRAYFAELDRRSETPFDPARGTSAEPHELRAPAGAFLIAYRRREPIGCGAVKHRNAGPSDIKRMWVAESARGLGIGRRLLTELEAIARDRRPRRSPGHEQGADRGDRALSLVGLRRGSPFNDEPFAHHWFEKRLR